MMKRKDEQKKFQFHTWLMIVLFLAMIVVPGGSFLLFGESLSTDTSENRTLAEKPELSFSTVEEFPEKYQEYFNDHLPFRKQIRQLWTNANFILLHDSTNRTVIAGDGDPTAQYSWLFLTAEGLGDSIADVEGVSAYSADEIKQMVGNMKKNTEELANKSIKTYFLVLPNKANVYREYLPDFIHFYREKSRTEEVVTAAFDDGINNLVYPKQELIDGKNDGTTYYRQDTHWNAFGSFIGFKKMMKMMEPEYDDFDYEVKYEARENFGDLIHATGIMNYLKDTVPEVTYLPENQYSLQKDEEFSKYNNVTVSINETAPIKKTLLIVGDSYRESIKKYFYRVYSRVIDLHRQDFKYAIVEKYKPDIILHENVERLSLTLKALKLYE